MDLGEWCLVKTSWLTLAFIYCICLFTLSLSSCIHLARAKTSCAYASSNKPLVQNLTHKLSSEPRAGVKDWPSQPLHEMTAHRGGRDPFLLVLFPFCCVAAQTGGTVQPHSWCVLVRGCSKGTVFYSSFWKKKKKQTICRSTFPSSSQEATAK